MTAALRHRGPDDSGAWTDPEAAVALGHARLSIIDLSPTGHQPMESASGRYVLTYNGEIYNYRPLRRDLEALGHPFRGMSDTEVMLAAFTEWGVFEAIPRFKGMFAFALWDRETRSMHLVRDRFGEKPLYYARGGPGLLFASELKALRAHPAFDHALDHDALTLYLRYGYFPAPYSVYKSTSKVMPGTVLTFDGSDLKRLPTERAYWSLQATVDAGQRDPFPGTPEEAIEELDRLVRASVDMTMVADVPLGAFLSGGVDSSTVVAMMQAQSSQPVRTFSIGFHEADMNEAHHAKAVAEHLGTDHTESYVTPAEARSVIPRLATMYDEPLADSSQIPTYLVSEIARGHVTVAVTGDAGDELFAGYDQYRRAPRMWSGVERLPRRVRRAEAMAVASIPSGLADVGYDAYRRVRGGLGPRRYMRGSLDRLRAVLRADSPEDLAAVLATHTFDAPGFLLQGIEPNSLFTDPSRWPERGDVVTRMTYLDAAMNMPDDILVKVDRASMAVSLETRVPLLDPDIAAFAWRLPTSLKIRDGRGKWILRAVLARYVPDELVDRGKMGFGVPVGEWLRGPLRPWAEDLLDERLIERFGVLRPGPARSLWSRHVTGSADQSPLLWTILMLQAWLSREHDAA